MTPPRPFLITLLLLASLHTRAAPPENPAPLYQATSIVTGTDTRQRPAGIADALGQVIQKLTGMPAPDLGPLDPAALVDHFAYVDPRAALLHHDDQGTYDRPHEITVWFDPAAVDAAIDRLGLHRWPEPRPLLVPVILVRTKDPDPFLLSAEAAAPLAAPLRATLVRTAASFGIGVHIPTADELAEWAVDTIGPPAPLRAPTVGRLLVAATLSFEIRQLGWTASWTTTIDGVEHRGVITGVGFDRALATMTAAAIAAAHPAP